MFMVIDFSFLLQCGGSVCLEAFNIIQALSGDYMASLDTLGGECWVKVWPVFEICGHVGVFFGLLVVKIDIHVGILVFYFNGSLTLMVNSRLHHLCDDLLPCYMDTHQVADYSR